MENLKPGDKIAILSTARAVSNKELKQSILFIETIGLVPVLGKTIGLRHNQFAGTVEQRIHDFQEKLDDLSIKAIWCARGGYGTIQILDSIDFSKFIRAPKWIIGYSDVTVLHAHINNMGIPTIHATMPINLKKNSTKAIKSLENALLGNPLEYVLENKNKEAYDLEGVLVGGNLSIINSLLGSSSQLKTEEKILMLEEVGEYWYNLHRMLISLKRAHTFNKIRALLIGHFTEMNDNKIPFGMSLQEIIIDCTEEFEFPIIFNVPFGHIRDNRAFKLGKTMKIKASEKEIKLISNYL